MITKIKRLDPRQAAAVLTREGFLKWCQCEPLTPNDFKAGTLTPLWAR